MLNRRLLWSCVFVVASVGGLSGCGSGQKGPAPGLALRDVTNADLPLSRRINAVRPAMEDARTGAGDPRAIRETIKALAWSDTAPGDLRVAAWEALITDPDPAVAADARQSAVMRLPRERNVKVIEFLARAGADLGWVEMTPALVRSYSRVLPGVPDQERAEHAALLKLHPGKPIEEIVYGVFISPPKEDPLAGFDANWTERLRADAWDLLARKDADGSVRMRLLGFDGGVPGAAADDPLLADMRACVQELGAVPLTGEELRWLTALRRSKDAADAAWWAEARAAIAVLNPEQRKNLRLRHAEPVRWAAEHKEQWLVFGREELLSELRNRLAGRDHTQRVEGEGQLTANPREDLNAWSSKLSYGDVLAILVVDEAVRSAGLASEFWEQSQLDRADTSTEYGGVLGVNAQGAWEATLYAPRPVARRGDMQFVASSEMVRDSSRALAHYHFHAQNIRNAAYAGPSAGDLEYAARSGRTCIVITTLGEGLMNVDVYFPGGIVVDLGEIAAK